MGKRKRGRRENRTGKKGKGRGRSNPPNKNSGCSLVWYFT